jgi:peptidase M28-like protein
VGRLLALTLACAALVSACSPVETTRLTGATSSPTPTATAERTTEPTPTPVKLPPPTPTPTRTPKTVAQLLADIDPARLDLHLVALTGFVSRWVTHPGHAKAIAYIKDELAKLDVRVESQRTVYQGMTLENIFATIDPSRGAVGPTGWVMLSAHYDSTANRTSGWRPASDPAPGADDNGTGTAGLLELARVLSSNRDRLHGRVVLAFFDGEELFFKGSAAYMSTLPKPYPYKAAINLDMVGFNPITDRLDLLWYTNASAGLRDKALRANDAYAIGVTPLHVQFAADGNTIMDAAPFGIAGIPSIALCQRYGENDATFPGNYTFHTVTDTLDKITNKRLWLKAAKLTLALALDLADEPAQ